jgi:hypothetical protein
MIDEEGTMSIELSVSSGDLRGRALQDLTQDFCETLVRDVKLEAVIKEGSASLGEKGEPITIGVIVLSLITSGAAVALFNAMSAYFARTRKLIFSLKKANGETISITSENISPQEREQTLKQLQAFLGD